MDNLSRTIRKARAALQLARQEAAAAAGAGQGDIAAEIGMGAAAAVSARTRGMPAALLSPLPLTLSPSLPLPAPCHMFALSLTSWLSPVLPVSLLPDTRSHFPSPPGSPPLCRTPTWTL